MKSIKPGRGPSMMGGVVGIFGALFGVFWTILAASMGAVIMVPFGLIFIVIAVVNVVYNFRNATGENRYSVYDITDESEESDPLNDRFGKSEVTNVPDGEKKDTTSAEKSRFCPYCGAKAEDGYAYCNQCGKKLP